MLASGATRVGLSPFPGCRSQEATKRGYFGVLLLSIIICFHSLSLLKFAYLPCGGIVFKFYIMLRYQLMLSFVSGILHCAVSGVNYLPK